VRNSAACLKKEEDAVKREGQGGSLGGAGNVKQGMSRAKKGVKMVLCCVGEKDVCTLRDHKIATVSQGKGKLSNFLKNE